MKYDSKIPECEHDPKEIAKQMRLNADIIMKEITEHINNEIKRLKEITISK